jgi:hypothetical protein
MTLEAVCFLRGIEGHRNPRMHHAPLAVVSRAWRRYVVNREQEVHRPAYTLCVVEREHSALRRHDIFVTPSERWGDPRAKLLQGEAWEGKRAQVCRTLNKSETPGPDIAALQQELDEAYRRVAENLPSNAAVRIEQRDGQDHLTLTGLDRLEEPESLLSTARRKYDPSYATFISPFVIFNSLLLFTCFCFIFCLTLSLIF